jgi:hypothetical protein
MSQAVTVSPQPATTAPEYQPVKTPNKHTVWMSGFLTAGPEEGMKLLPKRCVLSVFILVVAMEQVLKQVCAASDTQPLSRSEVGQYLFG